MEPDPEASPKARFRFGFTGKRKRLRTTGELTSGRVSEDDILDSLTRQASSQVGLGETHQEGYKVLLEREEPPLEVEREAEPIQTKISMSGDLGRFAFLFMFLGGLLVVWLYSSGTRLFDVSSLNRLVQNSAVHSIFTNPAQIGVISFIALVAALWVAQRRRSSGLRLSL